LLQDEITSHLQGFENTVRQEIGDWLRKNGLDPDVEIRTEKTQLIGGGIQVALPDPVGDVFDTVKVGLTGTLVVAIGVGLFATGPIGWLAILIGIISSALLVAGKETVAKQLENVPFPGLLLQQAISDESLEKSRKELEEKIREQVRDAVSQTKAQLLKACQTATKDSLREISELSNTKKLPG
jgi:enoyl-CoA hydratase/carnithine racemase